MFINGQFMVGGSPYNGATVKLWEYNAFGSPPEDNTALPDVGYLIDTVTTSPVYGAPGSYLFDTGEATDIQYYISIEYLSHIYWRTVEDQNEVVLTSLPTAVAALRGKTAIIYGGTGVADKVYMCLKLANGTYDWVQVG